MAKKDPATFDEYVDAVAGVAQEKAGLSEDAAKWLMSQDSVKQIVSMGWGMRNKPAKVYEALTAGIVSAWVQHNMK